MNWMPQAIRDGIIVVLVISGPLVLAAAFIGLIIGVLQAATQVQEQTIGSAVKIIGVFALIIFAGFWMFQYLNQYTSKTLATAFTFVPRQTQKVIPRHISADEEFGEIQTEEINLEPFEKPLSITPPEKIETKLPAGGIPGEIHYLGAPEPNKLPDVSKIEPPQIPKLPAQVIQLPKLPPLAPFQEPKPLSIPSPPEAENVTQTPNTSPAPTEEVEKINLLPGEPIRKEEIDPALWHPNELSSENTNSLDSIEKPSWLN